MSVDTASIRSALGVEDAGDGLQLAAAVDADFVGVAITAIQAFRAAIGDTGIILAALPRSASRIARALHPGRSLAAIIDAALANGAIIGPHTFELRAGITGAHALRIRVWQTLCRHAHFIAHFHAAKVGRTFMVILTDPTTDLLTTLGGSVVVEPDTKRALFHTIVGRLTDLTEPADAPLRRIPWLTASVDADLSATALHIGVAFVVIIAVVRITWIIRPLITAL